VPIAIIQKNYTITEFENFLAEHPGGLFELVYGEIVEKLPTEEYGLLAVRISTRLNILLKIINWDE
jgi:Uma2 family endonuclease